MKANFLDLFQSRDVSDDDTLGLSVAALRQKELEARLLEERLRKQHIQSEEDAKWLLQEEQNLKKRLSTTGSFGSEQSDSSSSCDPNHHHQFHHQPQHVSPVNNSSSKANALGKPEIGRVSGAGSLEKDRSRMSSSSGNSSEDRPFVVKVHRALKRGKGDKKHWEQRLFSFFLGDPSHTYGSFGPYQWHGIRIHHSRGSRRHGLVPKCSTTKDQFVLG